MENPITIATYTFPHEVYVDRSKLESYGIYCFVMDEITIQVHNFYSNALGGLKLQVQQKDFERAKKIISNHPDISTDYTDSKIKCPNCNSGNIDSISLNRKISLVILMLTGLPIPIFSRKYHCYECHDEFRLTK